MSGLDQAAVSVDRSVVRYDKAKKLYYIPIEGSTYIGAGKDMQKATAMQGSRPKLTMDMLDRSSDLPKDPSTILYYLQQTLKDIERLRDRTAIAYFSSYTNFERDGVAISDWDKGALLELLETVPHNTKKLDLIVHSPGGLIAIGEEMVKMLRNRFDDITFIVPNKAKSAATLMAMAANEIMLCEGAVLSPFDPLVRIPPEDEFVQVLSAIKTAKSASWHIKLFPFPKNITYPGWTIQKTKQVIEQARNEETYCKIMATLWLTKYMFGHHNIDIENRRGIRYFLRRIYLNYSPKIGKDYRTARAITSFFMDSELHIKHERPLGYSDICKLGLHLSEAEGEMKTYIREAYMWSLELFRLENAAAECPSFSKVWISTSNHKCFMPIKSEKIRESQNAR